MPQFDTVPLVQWILGAVLIFASLGVILARKPVHSCLFFLLTLMMLAALFLQLSAEFIAIMQVLVYAGAILVIFMFVIVLFQDAHAQIGNTIYKSARPLRIAAGLIFSASLFYMVYKMIALQRTGDPLPHDFGTVQAIGRDLYVNFFIPFEAITLLFLVAAIGALYIGRKEV